MKTYSDYNSVSTVERIEFQGFYPNDYFNRTGLKIPTKSLKFNYKKSGPKIK